MPRAAVPGPLGFVHRWHAFDTGTLVLAPQGAPGVTGALAADAQESQAATDLTPTQGLAVVREAATWSGTPYADQPGLSPPGPYRQYNGANAMRDQAADCSGSTWRIFSDAGFPYRYTSSSAWAAAVDDGRIPFRRLPAGEELREGDVLRFPGHLAIYAGNGEMWTARRSFYKPDGEYENRAFTRLRVTAWGRPVTARYRFQVRR
jgi:cell wall-associated NlpC family hydrolase